MRVSLEAVEYALRKVSDVHNASLLYDYEERLRVYVGFRDGAALLVPYINAHMDNTTSTEDIIDDPERILAAMAHGV